MGVSLKKLRAMRWVDSDTETPIRIAEVRRFLREMDEFRACQGRFPDSKETMTMLFARLDALEQRQK